MVNLSSFVAWHARATPNRPALIFRDQVVTYAAFLDRIERLAALLVARGIAAGDRVALVMKNSAAFLDITFAASHVGAVFVPVNFRLAVDEIAYVLDHAGAKLVFADAEFAGLIPPGLASVILDDDAQADPRALVSGALPAPASAPRLPSDLARLVYTSGTTSRPKGVRHSYANIYWTSMDQIVALGLSAAERLLVVGPLYHVAAYDLPGIAVLWLGGCWCILRDFSPEAVLGAIARHRLTGAWLAPVMTGEILACPDRGKFDCSSLRWIVGGGERTPEPRIHAFNQAFPKARYIDAYGLTESGSGDSFMVAGHELEKIGSTGRAVPHVEIQIRDDSGRPLASGQDGEICLRGPKISPGYWRDDDATAQAFHADGFFRTGDVGHLDQDGFLYLTDRRKDLIISGGENIASSEIERVLNEMPQIADLAVIGVPDRRWGERPVAVVVLKPGASLTLAEIDNHCRGRLAKFKVPTSLVVRESLPRNPSGKVLKRVLREEIG